ncbi:MAG: V-type ATP synthase subunit F [bacterium]
MSSTYKIAAIGDRDSIVGFKAVGIKIFPVKSAGEARSELNKLREDKNYAIIFITEPLIKEIEETINEANKKILPAVIPIPNNRGSTGVAMERMRKTVEKAVGVDILSEEKGES